MTKILFQRKTPPALHPGDKIGIVAPGSPFEKDKFSNGICVLKEMGFEPVFSDDLFHTTGYLAGSDTHRAGMINSAFLNDNLKAIWCARGGYGSIRILNQLDYDSICSHPKIFIGCSDISAILNTLYSKCGLVTFHGPMIESLASHDNHTIKGIHDLFMSEKKLSINVAKPIVIHSGESTGIVSGGNLTTITHLLGTPYQPDFSGHILLLEDIGEVPYKIDRMLSQMKLAGCFEKISGIIIGSFKRCGPIDQIYNIFKEVFFNMDIPILAGFEIGHEKSNLAIPFGIEACLRTDAGLLVYQHPHLIF